MTTTTFQVEPVVSYPREAVIGQTYLLTIDLRGPGGPEAWPFAEEEYAVYCLIEGGAHFSSRPLGEPAVVLHRFGGTYGPAEFLLTVQDAPATLAMLNLLFVSSFGAPLGSAGLPIAVVDQSSAPAPVVGQIAGEPERPQIKQSSEPVEAPVGYTRLHIPVLNGDEGAKYIDPNNWQVEEQLTIYPPETLEAFPLEQLATGNLYISPEDTASRLDAATAESIRQHAWTLFTQGQGGHAVELLQSLLSRLEHEGVSDEDTATRQQAFTLSYLGRVYYNAGRPDLALAPLQQAIALFKQLGDDEQGNLSVILGDLANANWRLGQLAAALEQAERGLAINRRLGNARNIAASLGQIAAILLDQQRYAEADARYTEAQEAAQQAGDRGLEGTILQHRGGLQNALGNYDQAVLLYQQAMRLFQQAGNLGGEMQTSDLLGTAEMNRGNLDAAAAWYSRARELAQQLNNQEMLGAVTQNLGILYQTRAEKERDPVQRTALLQQAVTSIRESLQIGQERQEQLGTANSLAQLGKLYRLLGDLEQADQHLAQARSIWEPLDHPNLYWVYGELALVAHTRGDIAVAAQWWIQSQTTRAALIERRGTGGAPPVLVRFEALLRAVTAVANGDTRQQAEVAEAVAELQTKGWMLVEPVQRIWAGERDLVALTQGLDLEDTALVARILEWIAAPRTLQSGAGQTADMPPFEQSAAPPPTPESAPATSNWPWPLILMAQSGTGAGIELYPNGIDGLSGQPLLRIDAASAAQIAINGVIQTASLEQAQQTQTPTTPFSDSDRADADLYRQKVRAQEASFGVIAGLDANQLEQTRWAVVVNANDSAQLVQALWPLIVHRCNQMGFTPPEATFRPGEDCATWWSRHSEGGRRTLRDAWGTLPPVLIYQPGEPVNQWLARHGVALGPVDPVRGVPYYLLLAGRPGAPAGDPATIPFSFQQQLGVFYAVGRLTFTNPDGTHRYGDYAIYAERVLFTEQRGAAPDRLRRELAFFGPRHDVDPATQRSADEFLRPLAEWAMRDVPRRQGFEGRSYLEDQATRRNLEALLGTTPPAILMLAAHGVGLPPGDAQQFAHQGALVTQDWDGFGGIRREHWFTGEDLGAAALHGMFAVLHASYSLGSPQEDSVIADAERGRLPIAPFAFIAQLPQQLLLRGALAVLGNVDRVWTYPLTGNLAAQFQPFEDLLRRLMRGRRIGDALDQFGVIHATIAMQLADEIENVRFGNQVDPAALTVMWMARNNARGMLLLGDPAVRLPFDAIGAA